MPRSGYRKAVFLLAAWMVWAAVVNCPAQADERVVFESRELAIVGQRSAEPTASYLQQIYPQVMTDLEQALGWKLSYKPTVVLVEDRNIFEQMGGSPYISAYAVPRERVIAISLPAVSSQLYVFSETFKHELCHLVLHDHIRGPDLPKWLDEGVCQWVSGSLGELLIGRKELAAGAIDLSRHAFPLRELADRFPGEKHALFLAYEESRTFVDYLTAHHGKQGLLDILKHMKAGDGIDEAVFKSLSKPLDTIEKEWLGQLNRRSLWLIWVGRYMYEILFFLAAVLAIMAFVRLRIKRRRYIEEEEDLDDEPPTDEE